MKTISLAVLAAFALAACTEEPIPEPTPTTESMIENSILTDEARTGIAAMNTDELVEALIETGGNGPDGRYIDERLLAEIETLEEADLARLESRLRPVRNSRSFRSVFLKRSETSDAS